jgi:hypothetical protein
MNNLLTAAMPPWALSLLSFQVVHSITAVVCAYELARTLYLVYIMSISGISNKEIRLYNGFIATAIVFGLLGARCAIYALGTRSVAQFSSSDILLILPVLIYTYSMRIMGRDIWGEMICKKHRIKEPKLFKRHKKDEPDV